MATSIAQVNAAPGGDKFVILIQRVNQIANALSQIVLTANATGGITSGNSFLLGILGANVGAFSTLRGGDIGTSSTLTIVSPVVANSSFAVNGLLTANMIFQGNVTLNSLLNETHLAFDQGNNSANFLATGWNVTDGTVTFNWSLPTSNDISSSLSFQHANGSWVDPTSWFDIRGTLAQVSEKTSGYTLANTDKGYTIEFNSSSPITLLVPNNAVGNFPVNMWLDVVQTGAGPLSFQAGPGVTLKSKANSLIMAAQYSAGTLYYKGNNVWQIVADLYVE